MKNLIYVLAIIVLTTVSCISDNNDNQQDSDSNFYALTVGNSWEYRWYGSSDNNTSGNPSDVYESITIVGTEVLNENLYYKFSRTISGNFNNNHIYVPENGEHIEYYRDSLGYLINEEGVIKFSNSATDEFVIYEYDEGFGIIDGQFVDAILYGDLLPYEIEYTTDAGNFQCLEVYTRIVYEGGVEALGNNRIYYAEGIGLISDDSVFVNSEANTGNRRKLISYNIQ